MRYLRVGRYTTYRRRSIDPNPTYHLGVEETTFLRHLRYQMYHWYDMRIPIKIPGWAWFHSALYKYLHADDRLLLNGHLKARWRDRLYMWDVGQDLRCYQYSRPVRRIADIEVDEETYKSLDTPIQDIIRKAKEDARSRNVP